MDKKKVEKLIEKTIRFTKVTDDDYIQGNVKSYIIDTLQVALKEISKSDWVSVEDGLPPYKVKYLWLACDKDGELVLFKDKPFRDDWYGFWSKWKSGIDYNCNDEITARDHRNKRFTIPRNNIDLSWEDEPIKVKLVFEKIGE